MIGWGGNGQWVRARSPEGAKAFLEEKRLEADRLQTHRDREVEFIGRMWGGIRRLFRRGH